MFRNLICLTVLFISSSAFAVDSSQCVLKIFWTNPADTSNDQYYPAPAPSTVQSEHECSRRCSFQYRQFFHGRRNTPFQYSCVAENLPLQIVTCHMAPTLEGIYDTAPIRDAWTDNCSGL